MRTVLILLTIFCQLALFGCGSDEPAPQETKPIAATDAQPATDNEVDAQTPPRPPIMEDFDSKPKMSLFPSVMGDFRPDDSDKDNLERWRTFRDHLKRVSDPAQSTGSGNRGWQFHSVKTIDSIGWFSPLEVEPNGTYQVKFRIDADLAEGARAGIAIIEFNKFLWVGEQYQESQYKAHLVEKREGLGLTGKHDWTEHQFDFTVSPQTRMIHLVLYRQGPHDPNPVMFDDIFVNVVNN